MVFYSTNSRKKVFHLPHCAFVKNMKKENRMQFDTPEDARNHGYRLCNCCSPIGQRLRKERSSVEEFCQAHGTICYLHDGQLIVTTPRSKWKIVVAGKSNKLTLYHRNTIKAKDVCSPIPKYHHQMVHKDSIVGYLDYIVEHDYFRMRTPLQLPPTKPPKPKKGTKRWKAEQEKKKRIAKRKAVQNVYALLAAI